jgi:hypothetical protein
MIKSSTLSLQLSPAGEKAKKYCLQFMVSTCFPFHEISGKSQICTNHKQKLPCISQWVCVKTHGLDEPFSLGLATIVLASISIYPAYDFLTKVFLDLFSLILQITL